MNKKYGILICPDTHLVSDVHAEAWTDSEIGQHLPGEDRGFSRRFVERTGDSIVVSAFLNSDPAGQDRRCTGFDLYGERFFGKALVVSGETDGEYPALDPHDICRAIHFFRLDQPQAAEDRAELNVAH